MIFKTILARRALDRSLFLSLFHLHNKEILRIRKKMGFIETFTTFQQETTYDSQLSRYQKHVKNNRTYSLKFFF